MSRKNKSKKNIAKATVQEPAVKGYQPKKVKDFEAKVLMEKEKGNAQKLNIDHRTEWWRQMKEDPDFLKYLFDEVKKEIEICDTLEGLEKYELGPARDEEIFRRVTTTKILKKLFKPIM